MNKMNTKKTNKNKKIKEMKRPRLKEVTNKRVKRIFETTGKDLCKLLGLPTDTVTITISPNDSSESATICVENGERVTITINSRTIIERELDNQITNTYYEP